MATTPFATAFMKEESAELYDLRLDLSASIAAFRSAIDETFVEPANPEHTRRIWVGISTAPTGAPPPQTSSAFWNNLKARWNAKYKHLSHMRAVLVLQRGPRQAVQMESALLKVAKRFAAARRRIILLNRAEVGGQGVRVTSENRYRILYVAWHDSADPPIEADAETVIDDVLEELELGLAPEP
jgi:hypothetical protein